MIQHLSVTHAPKKSVNIFRFRGSLLDSCNFLLHLINRIVHVFIATYVKKTKKVDT